LTIPKNIDRNHIIRAFIYIDKHGTPEERKATKFYVNHENKKYSPKYVVSVANIYANGEELSPANFSGGKKAIHFYLNLDFLL
jgi:hypothetical protein